MKVFVQKTIRLAMVFLFIAAGMMLNSVVQAQNKFILSTTEFTVKNGHASQFEEGIKAWKDCYLENKGEWTWTLWKRYNGKGSAYVMASNMANWAEMDDENDEAGKKCRQIAIDKIIPHIESAEDNFAASMPEISKTGVTEWNIIWVTFFRVDNSTIFNATIKEISDIMAKTEGDKRGYWYSTAGGGPDSPNFYVTTPYKNFAALDVERDGVWTLVEKAKGKDATEKMRADFRSAVSNSWSYIYKRMGELSNDQPK